ncbi:MAG: enoyl-CoA hydratase/isomerase family protein [Longimicrobiales bacterium]
MKPARVLSERGGAGVGYLTLNRAEKRNALDRELVGALLAEIRAADADAEVRVVVLRGAGSDFCAGADLAQLERIAAGAGPVENLDDAAGIAELLVAMRRATKPIIAAVHGHAIAGGAGLATACDIILAADDAVFGYPEVRLGFVPAMVMALLRRAVGEKVAFELVARGGRIDAREAHRLGLVNEVHPRDGFADAVDGYARDLATRSPSALRLIKRLFYGTDGMSFEDAIARGVEVNVLARMTEDTRAGVRRFLEKDGAD